MTLGALVDNDVLQKTAGYTLLPSLAALFPRGLGILGSARFVVAKRLAQIGLVDYPRAAACWSDFLAAAHELEPTQGEVELAAALLDRAIMALLIVLWVMLRLERCVVRGAG